MRPSSGTRTAWVPFPRDEFDDLPAELDYVTWDGGAEFPADPAPAVFYAHPLVQDPAVIARPLVEMKRLSAVQALSAGVDHLLPLLQRLPGRVTLCTAGDLHSASTAELALALVLASLRGIPDYTRAQDAGRWHQRTSPSLTGADVLIVGYGAVGAALEELLVPFGCVVTRVARTGRLSRRGAVHAVARLPELVPQADVIVLATTATQDTRHLVDAGVLARMKTGALLVNVARGSVVDTPALTAALADGRIRAALDVTEPEPLPPGHPLWSAPGVVITPHVGAFTAALRSRVKSLVQSQLWRFARNEPLRYAVPYPSA
ncbi:NAD(P)-dependent oxidoreductase [Amycolatopsis rhabdoformis]|uniref:NAD(P)-dependent oxidoreductase n=1 Tax=Amycolatopsis rhabdoformis TaxID=1448059 RepID=A0ABZ1IGJ0_9PSEU|nr:NAD(P)-dependent oxidoreductase [Amycolatopsis rhabdoformis]WSE33585.1 NAD(P)-dependent oxidoreductase [Amycolatopsis rhabdoformis]